MNILHIDASASDAAASHSRRLSAALVQKLKAANPGASVVYRDVAADRLPHVDMTIRQAWAPDGEKDASLTATATRSRAMVEELKAADIVVIGSPMYNFTVPSTLKAWIDHVAIAGQTFQYTASGPKGLLNAKAYLALSSGGIYSQGPFGISGTSCDLSDVSAGLPGDQRRRSRPRRGRGLRTRAGQGRHDSRPRQDRRARRRVTPAGPPVRVPTAIGSPRRGTGMSGASPALRPAASPISPRWQLPRGCCRRTPASATRRSAPCSRRPACRPLSSPR